MLFPDISEWQPSADIYGIRKQTPAIIIRAGYGHDHQDKFFGTWRASCHAAGFGFTGIYHYLRGDQDAAWQAQVYCGWVGSLRPGEIPVLDLEEGGGDQSARANAWLNYVDSHLGLGSLPLNQRSWLYSYPAFIASSNLNQFFDSARHTWLAAYSGTEPSYPLHTLWQCNDGAAGANKTNWAGAGYCDTNYTSHSITELAAMAFQGAPPPPPAQPGWTEQIVNDLPTLSQGATGNDVRTCQGLLAARGHAIEPGTADLGIDGIYGPATAAMIASVQAGWGLTADGITGPKTWAKLLNR